MSWQDTLNDYIDFLKERHELTDQQIREELFADKIPTDAYKSELTPLQAASTYLKQTGKTAREIAETIGRTTTEVESFLEKSAGHPPLPDTGIQLPATIFADRTLSASEHLVEALKAREHSVAEIAELLGKSPQTIWTLHYRIQEKRGDSQ